MFKDIHKTDDGKPVKHFNGDAYVHIRHYEELLEKVRSPEVRAINHGGKSITLRLSTYHAAVITEALRNYGTEEAVEMVDILLNRQEVRADD